MPATRLIALNGSAGAMVAVLATIPARKVFIREDEAGVAQGLVFQKPEDGFTQSYAVGTPGTPDQPQIALPTAAPGVFMPGRLLGMPSQTGLYSRSADTYIKLRSKTATATNVRVVEEE